MEADINEDVLRGEIATRNVSEVGDNDEGVVAIGLPSSRFGRLRGGSDSGLAVDDERFWEGTPRPETRCERWLKITKSVTLLIVWLTFTILLLIHPEYEEHVYMFSVPVGKEFLLETDANVVGQQIGITVYGAFTKHAIDDPNLRAVGDETELLIELMHISQTSKEPTKIGNAWILQIVGYDKIEFAQIIKRQHTFHVNKSDQNDITNTAFKFTSKIPVPFPISASYHFLPLSSGVSLIYAILLVVGMYTYFVLDSVHRSLIAILSCTFAVAILGLMNMRPSISTIIQWVHVDTLMLLFGMSIIVAIFADTGILDYVAVLGYELANGHIWPMLNCMCVATVVLAAVMDNIPVILIMSPITIRICEVMHLNPVPVLICLIVSSNIGAALTPIGDQPHIAQGHTELLHANGITIGVFLLHVFPGVFLALLQTYIHLRLYYSNSNKMRFKSSHEIERLRHVIRVWRMASKSVSAYSKGENEMRSIVNTKVRSLKQRMKRLGKKPIPPTDYEDTLKLLKATYPIKDKVLLMKCSFVMFFVVMQFVCYSIPSLHSIPLGWISLLGAILLIIIAEVEDMEGILARIEWSTLLFFTGLYVFTECIFQLGAMDYIGDRVTEIIHDSTEEKRLTVAILIILWVSALSAAFLSNLAIANVMLRIIISLVDTGGMNLPMQPLVWAMVLGASFGGNGSVVGATANVVGAGTVERHGYTFSFVYYLKVGLPIMIGNILMGTIYLFVAHVVFQWH